MLERESANPPVSITVSDMNWFDNWGWREALRYLVEGLRFDFADVEGIPKIDFGPLTLELQKKTGVWEAYWNTISRVNSRVPTFTRERVLTVGCLRDAVIDGMEAFLQESRICELIISFPYGGMLCLWKGDNDELECAGFGLPDFESWLDFEINPHLPTVLLV